MDGSTKVYRYPMIYKRDDGTETAFYKTVKYTAPPRKYPKMELTIAQEDRCKFWHNLLRNNRCAVLALSTEGIVVTEYRLKQIVNG